MAVGLVLGFSAPVQAQQTQPPTATHPYTSLAGRLQTDLRFVTDIAFPTGPRLQVKIYDWVMGPRQEFRNFPLEGLATIEVKAGEVKVTLDGVTSVRHEGEHFVVPPGATLSMKIEPDTGRGDNIVSLHGIVVIRR